MKKNTKLLASFLILGLIILGAEYISKALQNYNSVLTKEVIKIENGFGYQIYNGEKLLIQQEFIPVLKGKQPFKSNIDAKKVADLVIKKIKKGTSPEITIEELNNLEIVTLTE